MSPGSSYRVANWAAQGWIDTTQEALRWPIVEFQGWTAFYGQQEDFEIYLNDVKVKISSFGERPDVREAMGGDWKVIGWSTACDIEHIAQTHGDALALEIRVRKQTISRKYFRYRSRLNGLIPPLKVVLHMPKTGGTSLRMSLEEHGSSIFILPLYHGSIKNINSLSPSSIDKIDVVYGHTGYGFHEHIERPVIYMTVLRNPYDFVQSLYYYSKYIQHDDKMMETLNIIDALSKVKRPEFDNYYTRCIAGIDAGSPVTEKDLEQAITNIDQHFSFIGLAERPRQTFNRFSRIFGVPLSLRKENVTPDIVEREFTDPLDVNHAIREHASLDLKLYQYAVKRFWDMEIP